MTEPPRTQIWALRCDSEAVLRSFVEEIWPDEDDDEDDDAPLSAFVASQGQTWLDHDFMETLWAGQGDGLTQRFAGAFNIKHWGDSAEARLTERGIGPFNGLIVIAEDDRGPLVKAPCDADGPGWHLFFLGRY